LHGDERVLDFGAGAGICSRHIAACLQRGGHLDCVDVSRRWQEVIRNTLRRYANVGYHLGHITTVDLPDAGFDVGVVHFVLHDIPATERPTVVASLARKLKPGGRLIVREPQGEGLARDELEQLASASGLRPAGLVARNVFIGAVFDAVFTHP
jgi:ubiquinone/menaquinone biosynthesis C-methylase UbiE